MDHIAAILAVMALHGCLIVAPWWNILELCQSTMIDDTNSKRGGGGGPFRPSGLYMYGGNIYLLQHPDIILLKKRSCVCTTEIHSFFQNHRHSVNLLKKQHASIHSKNIKKSLKCDCYPCREPNYSLMSIAIDLNKSLL